MPATVGFATVLAVLAAAAPAQGGGDTTGSRGVGDPFFPKAGNGGYDVSEYMVELRYGPVGGRLKADTQTRIEAEVTQPAGLTRFHLDYRGPRITLLRAHSQADSSNDLVRRFSRKGQELIVRLEEAIPAGQDFSVVVEYEGRPNQVIDPDGSTAGWIRTEDGAFVVGEPQGTPTWMPANDHPTDKAVFQIAIRIPSGYVGVANGELSDTTVLGDETIYTWDSPDPMATYLATATIGRFDVTEVDGPRYEYYATDEDLPDGAADRTAEIVEFLEGDLGAYPFGEIGAIVDQGGVGYALETQTRPIYDGPPGDVLVAHELSHQWLGNSVTLERWRHIWLNEGFATWAEWWWAEHDNPTGPSVEARVDAICQSNGPSSFVWHPPPGSLEHPRQMFRTSVYERGGVALQRLRELIGETDFFAVLEAWAQHDPLDPVRTSDLIDLVKATSDTSDAAIDAHFEDYVFDEGKPEGCADSRRRPASQRLHAPKGAAASISGGAPPWNPPRARR